ncbi:hypothetical protein CQW23_23559 [Capsicum baccatum]|uniref:Uncharacterized protein n=1 Tax=Capsicum baccatum TaxID=33114 RepID=A0A2G2VS98_CAPBA|nr:hypothetical protein CQW23_23559 [Capsicum baccatum]
MSQKEHYLSVAIDVESVVSNEDSVASDEESVASDMESDATDVESDATDMEFVATDMEFIGIHQTSLAGGHSIEGCRALKREIGRMIQEILTVVQNIDTTKVTQNLSPSHDNARYMGNNESSMGIQNLFIEGNVLDNGESSSHDDVQISG